MEEENKMILYHYTTMNAFYNMLEHSLRYDKDDIYPKYITLWATHYAYQNDPSECQLFFEGLKNSVLDYTKKNGIELDDKDKKFLQHLDCDLHIYTISFSKHADDLTMWRGYGQNGDGISLGFDFSKLPSTLPMVGGDCKELKYRSDSDPTYLLYDEIKKCKYVDVNKISIAEKACDMTLRNIFDKGQKWTGVKQALINGDYAPIYKHKKYEAEGEYRIVTCRIIPKYRFVDNKLIPYVEIDVPIECLTGIVVGPCNSSSQVVMSINSFLWTKGIGHVNVVSSTIPFRNRL